VLVNPTCTNLEFVIESSSRKGKQPQLEKELCLTTPGRDRRENESAKRLMRKNGISRQVTLPGRHRAFPAGDTGSIFVDDDGRNRSGTVTRGGGRQVYLLHDMTKTPHPVGMGVVFFPNGSPV
jgi:hypothetical protein